MVPPDSHRIPRAPWYSGTVSTASDALSHTWLSHSLADLSRVVLLGIILRRGFRSILQYSPTTPNRQRLRPSTPIRFRLFPVRSPLLRESRLISFPPATKMFQFAGFASLHRDDRPSVCRVAPFGYPWITGRLAPPQGFSQLTTPFFASESLGIHHVPFLTSLLPSLAITLRSVCQRSFSHSPGIMRGMTATNRHLSSRAFFRLKLIPLLFPEVIY